MQLYIQNMKEFLKVRYLMSNILYILVYSVFIYYILGNHDHFGKNMHGSIGCV